MTTASPRILLTGATGFIGGTVLTALLASKHPRLQSAHIAALIRDEDGSRSAALTKAYGDRVQPIVFRDQDDSEHVTSIAAQFDIAINTTMGFHPTFGAALVQGLAQHDRSSGQPALMINTSGTTNVCDQPLTGTRHPDREFDDGQGEATYKWLVVENQREPYGQRTAELAVVDKGIATGVATVSIMSPTIYGVGSGLFNVHSMQIPRLTRVILQHGEGLVMSDGTGIWENVHVEDLADLYVLVVTKFLDGDASLPVGKAGIIFSGTRRHSWGEVSERITAAAHARGKIGSKEVRSLSAKETDDIFGDVGRAQLSLCSNSKTVATVAQRLGWKPRHGETSWVRGFDEEMDEALKRA